MSLVCCYFFLVIVVFVVVVVLGVICLIVVFGGWDVLWGMLYGWIVFVKVVLLGGMGLFGVWYCVWLILWFDGLCVVGWFWLLVLCEVVLMGLVFGVVVVFVCIFLFIGEIVVFV